MAYIMNALDQKVQTQAQGAWLSWAPGEIKVIHNENKAKFLAQLRGEEGLVEIPEDIMTLDKSSMEYKQAIFEKRKEGIAKFVQKQNYIVRNLEMSLRRDYETSGQKGDYRFLASKGELEAYKQLKKYQEFEREEQLNVADEIQKLQQDIYGSKKEDTDKTESVSARPSPLKPSSN